MTICVKLAKYAGMIFGAVAGVLVLLGVIGFIMWVNSRSGLFGVANFWNYLYSSIPFSLLAICSTLFVIAGKNDA